MDFGDLIPIAGMFAGVSFAWIGYKYCELKVTSRRAREEAAREAAEKKRLEARLAVLERLATDRGIHTAEQIDALRDGNQASRQIG